LVFSVVQIGGMVAWAGGFVVLVFIFVILFIFILTSFLKQSTPVTDLHINYKLETLL
jgi:hypothetical protein